ncbi:MAG: sugar phosphate isomerase/epimerase [Anaerolineae bacterium]|nr:sugar phosphate isomerase/epimerase [Anaerolineae bacterium]
MSRIRFGCQLYTWQMSGERYVGQIAHIAGVVREGGFTAIEPEVCMLGPYRDDPEALKDVLGRRGVELAAIALACHWREPVETEEERREADYLLDYLSSFRGVHLLLSQLPGRDRASLRERQRHALACVHAIGARAAERGIACSFHPNSPPGSVFRVEEDYRVLFDSLDPRLVGFAPDTGHIANGGMDVVKVFETYRALIRHVHFKDVAASGEWAGMGAGIVDFPRVVTMLRDAGYDGWVMVEEESAAAERDPDGVTVQNGRYVREALLPLI